MLCADVLGVVRWLPCSPWTRVGPAGRAPCRCAVHARWAQHVADAAASARAAVVRCERISAPPADRPHHLAQPEPLGRRRGGQRLLPRAAARQPRGRCSLTLTGAGTRAPRHLPTFALTLTLLLASLAPSRCVAGAADRALWPPAAGGRHRARPDVEPRVAPAHGSAPRPGRRPRHERAGA